MSESKKLRVLVTGATGFLGTQIIRSLAKHKNVLIIASCRNSGNLNVDFKGEIRCGDLRDEAYRESLTLGVDVICHAGTWGSFWGHHLIERSHFYEPTLDLISRAIKNKVSRFIMTSSVVIAQNSNERRPLDDFSPTAKTKFWPHVDYLVDIDNYMKSKANETTKLINMRLGHFVGKEILSGMIPALIPRLKTYMVPWLNSGRSRLALVCDKDLGDAFALASLATNLNTYESFNICGSEFPSTREVFDFISSEAGVPKPMFSVPYFAGFAFGYLMEFLFPLLPGKAPFLTRSLVHVSKDWYSPNDYAKEKIGYNPSINWRDAIKESIEVLEKQNYPWPALAQKI